MYIVPMDNSNNNVSMRGWKDTIRNLTKKVEQKGLDLIKEHTHKESPRELDNMKKVDEFISDPMWNRGIMGVTALASQPAIDYYNHRVDDETREVSRNRTISKIVAGSLVGMFVVRGPIYKMVENMTNINGKTRWSKALLPKTRINELAKNEKFLKNHRTIIAMLLSLGAMVFTNFLLDAPLTIFFTNLLNNKTKQKKLDGQKGGVKNE